MKCCLAVLVLIASTAAAEDAQSLKTVRVKSIELKIPEAWQPQRTSSSMRLAQFSVPSEANNGKTGEFVVFYFGGGATGGIKANVERWIGQFAADDRKLEMFQGKCAAGRYILVDTTGTWNKPDGPPFARKTIPTKNSRVINVILINESDSKEEYFFLKLSGDKQLVSQQAAALRTAIGVKKDTEKPYELE